MFLYDTLSGKKKLFTTRTGNAIEIFVCGPTVYDYSHIGHGKTYAIFDAFVKYLRHQGYVVRYVQNITDIDDKIIDRARTLNQTPESLARTFETEYYHDMEKLGIDSVDRYARATDHIEQIASQVARLIEKDYAYEIAEDGIYYDISKFPDYGKLSRRTTQQAEDAVSRIDESVQKRNKGDFALWKFKKSGEPSWPSPWGEGRPGWHIEDTAITEAEFGPQYDIHGGGCDLAFPHHEAEIAQMEAISGKNPLVNYWMHTGFLTINGKKMSKSLGNFITIHEFLEKHSKEVFRLFVLSSHYRSPVDFEDSAIKQAEENVRRLEEFRDRLEKLIAPLLIPPLSPEHEAVLSREGWTVPYIKNFYDNLADDFNTPKALAVLFEFVREANALFDAKKVNPNEIEGTIKFLIEFNSIFGIIPKKETIQIPEAIEHLAQQREKLRKENRWDEADKVRREIEVKGYVIKDTPRGSEIQKSKPA